MESKIGNPRPKRSSAYGMLTTHPAGWYAADKTKGKIVESGLDSDDAAQFIDASIIDQLTKEGYFR